MRQVRQTSSSSRPVPGPARGEKHLVRHRNELHLYRHHGVLRLDRDVERQVPSLFDADPMPPRQHWIPRAATSDNEPTLWSSIVTVASGGLP